MAIAHNALAENGVTAHDAMVALISISLHGNAGMAHAVLYSIARTAFKRRTTHINHETLIDTFPYGFPSYAQYGNTGTRTKRLPQSPAVRDWKPCSGPA